MNSSFASPEGIMMLIFAGFLDVMGLCELLFSLIGKINPLGGATIMGEAISTISDIIGLIIIGGWSIIRGKADLKSLKRKRVGLRFGFTFLGEATPFIGILPFWTIYVYSILKE